MYDDVIIISWKTLELVGKTELFQSYFWGIFECALKILQMETVSTTNSLHPWGQGIGCGSVGLSLLRIYVAQWPCFVWLLNDRCIGACLHACRVSRKLAVASWSYSCFRKGRGRSESNTVIFHSNPPLSSQGILKRCWKQMVTKSHHVSRLIWTLAFVHPPWASSITPHGLPDIHQRPARKCCWKTTGSQWKRSVSSLAALPRVNIDEQRRTS